MKTLKDYINERYVNEKLKLSDIKRDNIDGCWVDAKSLKFDDLQEGNVLELKDSKYNKTKYFIFLEDPSIAEKQSGSKFHHNSLFLSVSIDNFYLQQDYIYASVYKNRFPYNWNDKNQYFTRVYTRKHTYTNVDELTKDLKILYWEGDVKKLSK